MYKLENCIKSKFLDKLITLSMKLATVICKEGQVFVDLELHNSSLQIKLNYPRNFINHKVGLLPNIGYKEIEYFISNLSL